MENLSNLVDTEVQDDPLAADCCERREHIEQAAPMGDSSSKSHSSRNIHLANDSDSECIGLVHAMLPFISMAKEQRKRHASEMEEQTQKCYCGNAKAY